MTKTGKTLIGVLLMGIGLSVYADTDYPIAPDIQRANRKQVEARADGSYWKGHKLAACSVTPLSGIRRTPDLFPEDGDFSSPLQVLAAKGEYEPASFLLFAFQDLRGVTLAARDLVSAEGARIPASEIDLTVVKIWYQMGTAWCGFHADHLRRVPTPELLLHDEKLIEVDHDRKENFVRADFRGGLTAYHWISFLAAAGDHHYFGDVRFHWVHDAEKLRPFDLQKDAFKEFLATVHVPSTAREGLYQGKIDVVIDGKVAFSIPLELNVLPFKLPRPAVLRDLDREFYSAAYIGGMNLRKSPKLARNLVAHNMRNPLLPQVPNERAANELAKILTETGLDTNMLFAVLPGAGLTTSFPLKETDREYIKYGNRVMEASNTIARLRARLGDQVVPFAQGIDEAGPGTVRAERATWQAFHGLGAKIKATTGYHPYLLFNLDFALIPRQPSPMRKINADSLHAMNPDMLVGWYGDPHSGPENPDYTRRLFGWVTWRNNYDLFCQYILFRDDWAEFWVAKESVLRGLMICYPQDGDVLDTLAWEGVREAVDDIRYTTLLRQYAVKALESHDMETVYTARAAMAWLTQVDFERSSLDYLRYETIARILELRSHLEKEAKYDEIDSYQAAGLLRRSAFSRFRPGIQDLSGRTEGR